MRGWEEEFCKICCFLIEFGILTEMIRYIHFILSSFNLWRAIFDQRKRLKQSSEAREKIFLANQPTKIKTKEIYIEWNVAQGVEKASGKKTSSIEYDSNGH